MRQLTVIIITLFSIQFSAAQIHEFGLYLGGSNFIGDVGATDYIAPKNLTIGGIYKWNRSPRHSYRISLLFSELEGIDKNSDDPSRQIRGLEFNSQIIELSAGMEFTFLDFNLHKGGFVSAPYLYTGVTVTKHDNFFLANSGQLEPEGTESFAYGIPMVVGYKAAIAQHFVLAFEIGARYTFSDEIDGSVPDAEELQSRSFGNLNNNDWYTFTGVTLTYTFGKNPCYCAF
ncbi:hypothetical protein FHS04_001985 [Mesoflavibacter sabulilitoris]|uniref:DUF6089 domain-containing protein n=1 Tax=Mesoflavibacter zeaxanthinifaciens subsp. sabulilitoris TaxID=1520893 RepID=A0A2T1NLS0_9FLAO|nr:DUF6089 family protein [Mesoflavibacter zeaxanthinifaciens]MBB3124462.1 hypothetical protein [Mesoflavibacter zeaxanthinifaciens subsp. sabulilitoris]PSG93833.1 hypothetical protein C7H61_01265 [Mesoflavibacter zeaxanthinifaciens subsp. sabulilitoris]